VRHSGEPKTLACRRRPTSLDDVRGHDVAHRVAAEYPQNTATDRDRAVTAGRVTGGSVFDQWEVKPVHGL
jgi:hypothetical protein